MNKTITHAAPAFTLSSRTASDQVTLFVGHLAKRGLDISAALFSLASLTLFWVLLVVVPYVLASLAASVWLASQKGWWYAPLSPLAFAALHWSYGIGFLAGILFFSLLKNSFSSQAKHAR